jgi:hypothetical protein
VIDYFFAEESFILASSRPIVGNSRERIDRMLPECEPFVGAGIVGKLAHQQEQRRHRRGNLNASR